MTPPVFPIHLPSRVIIVGRLCFLTFVAIASGGDVLLAANRLYDTRDLFGLHNFTVQDMTEDGLSFVGFNDNDDPGRFGPVHRWSWQNGLSELAPGLEGRVMSMSADGDQMVLSVIIPSATGRYAEYYQWTSQSGLRQLSVPTTNRHYNDAAPDGSLLVGDYSAGRVRRAIAAVWDGQVYQEQVIVPADNNSSGIGVSDDGSAFVADRFEEGLVRFTQSGGLTVIEPPPGYIRTHQDVYATSQKFMSADGTALAGYSDFELGQSMGFRWTEQKGTEPLGWLPGCTRSDPASITDDGQIVFGGHLAHWVCNRFIWDEVNKIRSVSDVLKEFQLDVPGDNFYLDHLSADRKTAVAHIFRERSFILRLDRPLVAFASTSVAGDVSGDGLVTVSDVDYLMSAIRDRSTEKAYDLNGSGVVEAGDLAELIRGPLNTWFGDATLNGFFDSGDLVAVFVAGQYEDDVDDNSTWATGDWNADGDFTTSDLVVAFMDGGYEQGRRVPGAAVPEPTGILYIAVGICGLLSMRAVRYGG